MNWTITKPSEPGWYWWRAANGQEETIYKVCNLPQRGGVGLIDMAFPPAREVPIEEIPGEWAGPLEPPPNNPPNPFANIKPQIIKP